MTGCCTTDGTDRFFSKQAARYAKTFRRKGPDKPSARLIGALCNLGVESKTVLDIGCGVGSVHLSLLRNGAHSAVGVEISEGMLVHARKLAAESGFASRVRYVRGDFLESNDAVGMADIVVMDKVLCCHELPEPLLRNAALHSEDLLGVSYPRNGVMAKIAFHTLNRIGKWLRWSFHPFYHDPATVDRTLVDVGFREVFSDITVIWQIKVFSRKGGGDELLRAEGGHEPSPAFG